MKKHNGSALVALAVVMAVLFVFVGMLLGYNNTAVEYEADINKFDKNSQNTLSSYTMKVKEMAQVPDKYKNDLQDIIKATFEGRYGENGSQATMQWITEQNLSFDSSMYAKLQTVMSAGRDEFKLSQDRKLENCTQYDKYTKTQPNKMILSFLGYPSDGIDVKCRIIVDKSTTEKFETGVDDVIKI